MQQITVTYEIRATNAYRLPVNAAIRLLVLAIATRLGYDAGPCPYCNARRIATRWPWGNKAAPHIEEAHPLKPRVLTTVRRVHPVTGRVTIRRTRVTQ